MRKPNNSSVAQDKSGSGARPERPRQPHADSRLESLYQDTLDAPIPQDMMRLLEKLDGGSRPR